MATSIKANTVLTKKLGSQKPTQAAPPSGGRPVFDQKAWEANLDANEYCWTHTSANCKGTLGGHKSDATRNDIKGGRW
jgi:hypothetical protein